MNKIKQKKEDILIVDDVPENLQLLFSMLTKYGYEVRRVLTGKQALKAAQNDPPDLILLDIKIPDLDGYKVCEQLKKVEKTKDIPVIFMSALNDTFDKLKAFEVGGVDYITKPFELPEVLMRVENQLKLLKMRRELEEKNKSLEFLNHELEAFSYRISHDLRNILTRINGFSGLLATQYSHQLDEKGKKYAKLVYNAGLRMAEMIEDLLRLSQVKSIDLMPESFDLSMMVTEIVEQIKERENNRQIELLITPSLIVEGDQNLLKIAVENLLENAYKYTSKNPDAKIEFGEFVQNNTHVYFVKDNGAGFDPKKADKLFVPFHRLHDREDFEGTGIGLSTVKTIIERHGGKIWFDAEINQGATFYFTLCVN
jgi:two-component system, sensor histidine kinase and response regulator